MANHETQRRFGRRTAAMMLALGAGAALLAGGCDAESGGATADGKHRIVTTVGMITDIVQQVAGERAEVTGIMASGIDPHLYKPTRGDIIAMQDADVIFYNGLMLEGKMADVLVKVARSGKPVYAVTDLLDKSDYVMTDEAEHYDPHVWMDVKGWMKAVEAVREALSEYDPAGAEAYRANAQRYLAELTKLDAYASSALATIPQDQRVLITAHDAFGYFGRRYGLDVRGIQGISTESEAGVKRINDLVALIVERKIPAVFVETTVADKNVKALIEGAASAKHYVDEGGTLFSDAMGEPGTYEGTYIGMIDHNVTLITRALGGQAPPRGMNGKLAIEP